MRIVFFGATALGYRCLEQILDMRQDVVGIFTIPQDFRISYSPNAPVRNVLHRDFHTIGVAHNIPVISVTGQMAAFESQLAELRPDLLVVIGWYYMIPSSLRALAAHGCVGVHASLLPRYRGGAPLVWAMINGESKTGVTLFHFTNGVDDGDIVGQTAFDIDPTDTIADLLVKSETAALALVTECVPQLANGTAPRIPQDHSQATTVPQRSPADGEIDWSWDNAAIDRFIRAQTKPYPGAFTILHGKRVTIWSADITDADAPAV